MQVELFDGASRGERIEQARARRAEKRERALALRTEGQTVEDVTGEAWQQAAAQYFGVQPEQPRLF